VEELELNLRNESEKRHELEMLRKEMGEIGGAGHFFGNDKRTGNGGERDQMGEEELKKVQRLLAAGENKINLKEREFRAFLSGKNGTKLKKSFYGQTIWRSPSLDGRSSSRVGMEMEERSNSIFGLEIKVKIKI